MGERKKICVGDKFGLLTVVEETDEKKNYHRIYRCSCSCGGETLVRKGALVNGSVQSCGCLVTNGGERKPVPVGTKFGTLTTVGPGVRQGEKDYFYPCLCECGVETTVRKFSLLRGLTQSCGSGEHRYGERQPIAPGTVFGRLTVQESFRKDGGGSSSRWYYHCRCECGNETDVSRGNLTSGQVVSCGCASVGKGKDRSGERIGRLLLLERIHKQGSTSGYQVWYRCSCECGSEVVVPSRHLFKSDSPTQSCGCLRLDVLRGIMTTHGYYTSHPTEYHTWHSMVKRCTDPELPAYKDYGARGIVVCQRWLDSFDNFYMDMGDRPGDGYSIDRIDVNGPYSPDNCRWTTRDVQANNKRNSHKITVDGVTKTLTEWCRALHITESLVRSRLKRGLTPQDALLPTTL